MLASLQALLRSWGAAIVALLGIAAIVLGYWIPAAMPKQDRFLGLAAPQVGFAVEIVLIFTVYAVVGIAICARLGGVLLDSRNRYSIVQLTTALWTALLLAGTLAAALANLARSPGDPLALGIPVEIFQAAGIAATALVGTPIVRSVKRENGVRRSFFAAGAADPTREIIGKIVQNTSAAGARWTDIFEGEEKANWNRPDLSRIQLFYFTILAVGIYGVQLLNALGGDGALAFPPLDQGLVGLLLLSNGTSLVYQAAPHGG